jgi:peptidoglycan/LPS O-acetylase OafA/YrhL
LIVVAVATVVVGAQVSRLLDSFSYFMPPSAESVAGIYFYLWFPRQLPCFVFGIMLFRFTVERGSVSISLARNICLIAVALMLVIPFLEGIKYALPLGLATTYAIAFTLFAFSLMYWSNSPLVGRPIVWIGKVSYSAYFAHFAVLRILPLLPQTRWPVANLAYMYSAVVIITIGISSITYLLIEKPMIRLGSVLIAARRSSAAGSVICNVK